MIHVTPEKAEERINGASGQAGYFSRSIEAS